MIKNIDSHIITSDDFKTTIEITEPIILEIGEIAKRANTDIYIVGGYVRDSILGRPRTDFDFTVDGDCFKFAELVAKHFHSNPVFYKRFRTALVPIGDFKCEFVGTRKEVYNPDSRNPDVSAGSLFDDIRRRDFTINCLAAKIHSENMGRVIDLFDGLEDLKAGILRTPLDPKITFSEDPLRIMRAARFASQLSFSVTPECLDAAREISERIRIISVERISDELLKIIDSPRPSVGLQLMYDMHILNHIFPDLYKLKGVDKRVIDGIEYNHKDIFNHTLKVVDKVASASNNTWLRFAALIHDIAKPRTKHFIDGVGWSFHGHEELGARRVHDIFKKLKLPFDYAPYVETLVRLHQRPMALVSEEVTDSAVRRLAFNAGEALDDLFTLCRADITTNNPRLSETYLNNYEIVRAKVIEIQEKDKLREFQSPVRGEEIMEVCNLQPSLAVGLIKSAIEDAILDGIIPNEYINAKAYFLENKDTWLSEIASGVRHK